MRSKNAIDSPKLRELRKKRKNLFKKRLLIFASLFILFLVGLGFLANLEDMKISEISISGNKIVEAKELEDFSKDFLGGNFLWFYPKDNVMLYPAKDLEQAILQNFKRVEKLDMTLNSNRHLEIRLFERGVKYIWCESVNACYFADDYGYVFDQAPYFSGPVYIKFFGGLDVSLPIIGQTIAGENFSNISSFAESVKALGLLVAGVSLDDPESSFIYLNEYSENSPKLIFNARDELHRVLENLKTGIESEPLATDLKNKPKDLLYIDLRFGNKVYFKFK